MCQENKMTIVDNAIEYNKSLCISMYLNMLNVQFYEIVSTGTCKNRKSCISIIK